MGAWFWSKLVYPSLVWAWASVVPDYLTRLKVRRLLAVFGLQHEYIARRGDGGIDAQVSWFAFSQE